MTHDSLLCPSCRQHIRFERDLVGGVREVCICGYSAPLERRPPPPNMPKIPSSTRSDAGRHQRTAYCREYFRANRDRLNAMARERRRRRRAA